MRWIKAIILVFSTYTRIPTPRARWDSEAMKLAIAFLPLAGGLIGCAVWGWRWFCHVFDLSAVLFAAITVALPIFITGGIHMDGYCDTSDALATGGDKERGLAIMKDPNVGAFALIRFITYILISFALLYELFTRGYDRGICWIYFLSRCLAAWSVLLTPGARVDGMLISFTKNVERRAARVILLILTAAGAAGFVWLAFPCWYTGLIGLALCLPVAVWYRSLAIKQFGGVTGDTTGYFLQMAEITLLTGLLAGGLLWELL